MNALTSALPSPHVGLSRVETAGTSKTLSKLPTLEAQLLDADTAQFQPPNGAPAITVTSRKGPMLALARELIALGYPPEQPIQFTWASTGTPSLYSASLAALAGLVVTEKDSTSTRFGRYRPFPHSA